MSDSQVTVVDSPEEPGHVTVQVRGALSIPVAGEVHAALVASFARAAQVLLDLEGVEEIDLTGLQLVCAAHRSSRNSGKTFLVKGNQREPIALAASRAGFVRRTGCMNDTDTCFWSVGGSN